MFQSNFILTVQFKRKDQLKFGICLDSYSTSHHSLCATWALRCMLACAGRECTHPRVDLLLVLETFTLNRTMHKRCMNLIHWKIGRIFSSERWIGFQVALESHKRSEAEELHGPFSHVSARVEVKIEAHLIEAVFSFFIFFKN